MAAAFYLLLAKDLIMKKLLSKPTQNDYIQKVPKSPEATQLDICNSYIPMATLQVQKLADYLDFEYTPEFQKELRILAIHDYLTKNVRYHEDKAGIEQIKLPRKLFSDKKGDCEDFTIITSAVLCVWNIPHTVRMADYGEGWQHIYVVAEGYNVDCTEKKFDAVPDPYKVKDIRINPEATLKKAVRYQTLGKLPVDLITPRETFYLDFWQELLKVGAKTYKKSFNTKYSNISGLGNTFPEYDLTNLIESISNVAEAKSLSKEQYEVRLKTGQIFRFAVDGVAELVDRIAGKEALKLKSSDTGLSPFNKALVKSLMPFVIKGKSNYSNYNYYDKLKGIYFSKKGAVATNGYSGIWVKGESSYEGIYLDNQNIGLKYVDFESGFRSSSFETVEYRLEELYASVKQVISYSNDSEKDLRKVSFYINEKFTSIHAEDEKITKIKGETIKKNRYLTLKIAHKLDGNTMRVDLNGIELMKVLNYAKSQGFKKISLGFDDPNKPIIIDLGNASCLLMPLKIKTDNKFYQEGSQKPENIQLIKAKAIAMKMKALALKL